MQPKVLSPSHQSHMSYAANNELSKGRSHIPSSPSCVPVQDLEGSRGARHVSDTGVQFPCHHLQTTSWLPHRRAKLRCSANYPVTVISSVCSAVISAVHEYHCCTVITLHCCRISHASPPGGPRCNWSVDSSATRTRSVTNHAAESTAGGKNMLRVNEARDSER